MSRLPPGPSKLSMIRMMFDFSSTLSDYTRKYGDPMTLPTAFGKMVIATAPEGNKAIFSADPDTFVASTAGTLDFLFKSSVLVTAGAEHRRARKLLTPPFHGARMRAYGNLMRQTARAWAERWVPAQPFQMIDTTQGITLDVIIEAVFGVADSEKMRRFREEILAVLGAFSPLIFFPAFRHRFLGIGPWARFQRHYEALRTLVFGLIDEYRRTLEGREDILSLLVAARDEEGKGLSAQEIMDQLLTIVFAGHETTAVMLAWMFYLLGRNPDCLERLRAEIASVPGGENADPEALARLPYLEAVCNETLRLYPPVHVIHRRLVKPLTLLGYDLPVGTVVAAGAFSTHRLESLYPEPDKFKPERFLSRSYSPFEFLPWGGGARRCLGAAFAMYEMKLVLATIVPRYRLRLLEKGEVGFEHRPGTVGPKGGIKMALEEKIAT